MGAPAVGNDILVHGLVLLVARGGDGMRGRRRRRRVVMRVHRVPPVSRAVSCGGLPRRRSTIP